MRARVAVATLTVALVLQAGCKTKVPEKHSDLADVVQATGGDVEIVGDQDMQVRYSTKGLGSNLFPKYESALTAKGWTKGTCSQTTSCRFTKGGRSINVEALEIDKGTAVAVLSL